MNVKLDASQWKSIGKGALIACAGALLTYLTQWASGQNFGTAGPIVAALLAVATNYTHKAATTTAA